MSAVNWGNGAKFIQVELDPAGGTSYTDMGTTQLMSVPYALFAGKSADLPAGTGTGNTMWWNGTAWVADNTIYNDGSNVGIGTATPASKLDVEGGVAIGTSYSGTSASPANGAIIEGRVGIGTSNPDNSAALDVSSTTGAILVPRMTQAQRDALSPVPGMIIHNTTINATQAYTTALSATPTVDISQTLFNTVYCATSAQSFIPTVNGKLYSITLQNDGSGGTLDLYIRSGAGIGGNIIASQTISIPSGAPIDYEFIIFSSPTLTAGLPYTFELAGSCTFGLRANNANPYAQGNYFSGGSGIPQPTIDLYFKTKMNASVLDWFSMGIGATGATGATGPQGPSAILPSGTTAGNTSYWDGSSWVVNSSNLYNNGADIGIGTSLPTAKLDVEGDVKLGTNGSILTDIIKSTETTVALAIAANTTSSQTYAIPNTVTGSSVMVSPSVALASGLVIAFARVSSAGTVQVYYRNTTAASVTLAAGTSLYITVIR
jgi:hypothetical protein